MKNKLISIKETNILKTNLGAIPVLIFVFQLGIIVSFGAKIERNFWLYGRYHDLNKIKITKALKLKYILGIFGTNLLSSYMLYTKFNSLGMKNFLILVGLLVGKWLWAILVLRKLSRIKNNESQENKSQGLSSFAFIYTVI